MPKNTQILACRDCKALYSQFFQLIVSLFRYGGLVIWAVLPMWHASALHSLHSRVTSPPDLLLMLKDTEKVFSIQKAQEINLAPFFVYQNMFYFYINPASVKQFFIKSGPNESHLVELSYDISLF